MTASLIKKEFSLTTHPMTFVFVFFGAMLLIPSYPYTVAFFYVCLGLFFTFINARENKDNLYMSLLPVSKKDIVKSKVIFAAIMELASVIMAVPFAVLSVNINPNGKNMAGMEPNLMFFGCIFILFAGFNYVFFTSFYKTAYKVGKAFIFGTIPVVLVAAATETISHIPYISEYTDSVSPDMLVKQIPVLLGGMLVYVLLTYLAYKKSTSEFESVDL